MNQFRQWHWDAGHPGMTECEEGAYVLVTDVAPYIAVATAAQELLEANSYYFPVGNPWGDKLRAAIAAAKEDRK